jgi:hypothetical protein
MSATEKYSMFHVDMYYDLDSGIVTRWPMGTLDLKDLDFQQYLDLKHPSNNEAPLIVYDNYLSIFEELYEDQIGYFFMSTQAVGTPPVEDSRIEEIKIGRLADCLRMLLFDDNLRADGWISNLDLDFFFSRQPKELEIFLADSYLDEVFGSITDAMNANKITCLTVALSPECSGGWENAKRLCGRLAEALGIDFSLPK